MTLHGILTLKPSGGGSQISIAFGYERTLETSVPVGTYDIISIEGVCCSTHQVNGDIDLYYNNKSWKSSTKGTIELVKGTSSIYMQY